MTNIRNTTHLCAHVDMRMQITLNHNLLPKGYVCVTQLHKYGVCEQETEQYELFFILINVAFISIKTRLLPSVLSGFYLLVIRPDCAVFACDYRHQRAHVCK